MSKGRLFLIHWKDAEIEALAAPLRAQGWQVEIEAQDGARACTAIKANPPDAVVIYLRRLPSPGGEAAAALATMRPTRHIPVIFVDGQGEALEKTKARVPSAVYVTVEQLQTTLEKVVGTKAKR